MAGDNGEKLVLWLDEIGMNDVPLVGGKNASLGEMYHRLDKKGIKVPNAFAVTSYAYQYFLKYAGIKKEIEGILKGLNTSDVDDLMIRGREARETIIHAQFPPEMSKAILDAYARLGAEYGVEDAHTLDVAVRSSATAEDMPDASFAGQQDTFLNILGKRKYTGLLQTVFRKPFYKQGHILQT